MPCAGSQCHSESQCWHSTRAAQFVGCCIKKTSAITKVFSKPLNISNLLQDLCLIMRVCFEVLGVKGMNLAEMTPVSLSTAPFTHQKDLVGTFTESWVIWAINRCLTCKLWIKLAHILFRLLCKNKMIKGLYYRYQPNGSAVSSAASGWSSFHGFLAELCWRKTLEWCRNPVAASGRSLWALTLRNKGKGEGQKLWIKKEHKKMPYKKISQITNKNF